MHLDEPLSDKEFKELDQFLLSDRCAEDGMTMDSLHGFLTALAIGPEEVLMAEWLPCVWGSERKEPQFKSQKEAERITALIARFMNEVVMTFDVAPKEFEPLFCEHEVDGKMLLDGDAWAWGFWEGMNLRAEAWEPIWSSNIADMVEPIYLLGAEEIEEEEAELVDDPTKRHKLAVEMEAAIPHIHRYWKPLRKSAVQQVQREAPKVGRNDPCPCGSGKKFKKCCGADQPDA
ncbi:YecA family protein [Noviherbaspirillum agri]